MEDLDLDSVYRTWNRYHKKIKKIHGNFPTKLRGFGTNMLENNQRLFSEETLEEFQAKIIKNNIDKFYTLSDTFDKSLARQLKSYLLYHFSGMNYREIAKMVKKQFTTIHYQVNNFQSFMDSHQLSKDDLIAI